MTTYTTECRENGAQIEEFATLDLAENALTEYEADDVNDDTYTDNYYAIRNNSTGETE